MDEIAGSRSSGFRSEGARFYTWQPERAEVVSWVAELAPFDRPGAARRG
jgi:D-hexose-6-phosphate mutarotase